MTTEAATPFASYTIGGIGPYTVPWPYEAGGVLAQANIGGEYSDLDAADYSVTPASSDFGGALFLTPEAAAVYDGTQLILTRQSPLEQPWQGTQGPREVALARQLDRVTRTLQELWARALASPWIPGATMLPGRVAAGRALIYDGQRIVPGATANEIAAAQGYAEDAKREADRAEAAALPVTFAWDGPTFVADGVQTTFDLPFFTTDPKATMIFADGVKQKYLASYDFVPSGTAVSGHALRTLGPLPWDAGTLVEVLYTRETNGEQSVSIPRAQMVSDISLGYLPVENHTYLLDGLAYLGAPGATVIADLPGLVPVNPTPEHFGAVGNGVADDTAAVIAVVASALASGSGIYFGATYLTTATIPNLHNIYKFGPGAIKVGSRLFPVQPQRTVDKPRNLAPNNSDVTNTLFVATTGSNTNDGLGAGRELLTLGGAFNVMANYGPTLSGLWKVSMAAGTYAANASAGHKFMSHSPIFIEGQPTAGAWTEPTTIIDGVAYLLNGIEFNYFQAAYIKDIKTTRCANGVIGARHCQLVFENVWSRDDEVGRTAIYHTSHRNVGGGQILAARYIGVQEQFNCTSDYNRDPARYLLIDGQGITETGWLRKAGSVGHLDHVEIMGCTQAELDLQTQSVANVTSMKLGGGASPSPVGIMVANSEIHGFNSVVYNAVNPATTPIRVAGSGQIADNYGWTGNAAALTIGLPAPILIGATLTDQIITSGAGADQVVRNTTLRQGMFRMAGYCWRIEAVGVVTGDGSGGVTVGTLQFRVIVGGSAMFAVTLPAGVQNAPFRFFAEITTTAAGAQKYIGTLQVSGMTDVVAEGTAANGTMGLVETSLRARRSVGTDVFTFKTVKVFG